MKLQPALRLTTHHHDRRIVAGTIRLPTFDEIDRLADTIEQGHQIDNLELERGAIVATSRGTLFLDNEILSDLEHAWRTRTR